MPPNINNGQDVHPTSPSPMSLSAGALSTLSPSPQEHQPQNGSSTPTPTLPDPISIVPPRPSSPGPGLSGAADFSKHSTPANVANGEKSFLDGHQDPQTLKT